MYICTIDSYYSTLFFIRQWLALLISLPIFAICSESVISFHLSNDGELAPYPIIYFELSIYRKYLQFFFEWLHLLPPDSYSPGQVLDLSLNQIQ